MRRWPLRRETWRASGQDGTVYRSRILVSVELWPLLLGWWVVERYGRVTNRRWRWSGRAAEELYDEAVAAGDWFATAWPASERRTVLPLVAGRHRG